MRGIVRHGLIQAISQAIALITGLLAIRAMSKGEYAAYSVPAQVVGTVSYVADGGMGALLLGRGAAVLGNLDRVSTVFASAARLRLHLGIGLTGAGLIWIAVLLERLGYAPSLILLIAIAAALNALSVVNILTYANMLRLVDDLAALQRSRIANDLVRLAVCIALVATEQSSPIGWLFANAAVSWLLLFQQYSAARGAGLVRAEPDASEVREFRTAWRRQLSITAGIVVGEQLVTAIIAFKGGPVVTAEVAALSRLAVVFTVINSVMSDIATPRIARSRGIGEILSSIRIAIMSYVLAVGGFALICLAFSGHLLALLGDEYSDLRSALVVMALATGLRNFGHEIGSFALSRRWLFYPHLYIVLLAIWTLASILMVDVSTAFDGAWIYLTQAIPNVVLQLVRIWIGITRRDSDGGRV